MCDIKLTKDFLKRVDMIEEQSEIDAYTPIKKKKITGEELLAAQESGDYPETNGKSKSKFKILSMSYFPIAIGVMILLIIFALVFKLLTQDWPVEGFHTNALSFSTYGTIIKRDNVLTDGMAIGKGDIDSDGDGISNRAEILLNLNPNSIDTDRDGVPDKIEYETDGMYFSTKKHYKEYDRKKFQSMGNKLDSGYIKEELDIEDMANRIGIDNKHVVSAFKIYTTAGGKLEVGNQNNVMSVLQYVPRYNGFRVLKSGKDGDKAVVDIENSGVVIAFNINAKDVFKKIKYMQVTDNLRTLREHIDTYGLLDYDEVFSDIKIVGDFDLSKNTLNIPTIWSSYNEVNSLGQAWFTGAIYNGVEIKNYKQVTDLYNTYKWIKPFNYVYNLADIDVSELSSVVFKDEEINGDIDNSRKRIEIDLLPRPDKEIAGAIVHLNEIGLDIIAERLAIMDGGFTPSVIDSIINEIESGKTVLAVMKNKYNIHAVLIYGYAVSNIDKEVYNFAVYDSNINYKTKDLQLMQAERFRYSGDITGTDYVDFRYGTYSWYLWDTIEGDFFAFYRIGDNLTLEYIE